MKNLLIILLTVLAIGCSSKPPVAPDKPVLPKFTLTGTYWNLSVPGEAAWEKAMADENGFKVVQQAEKTQALFDTMDEPGLTLDDATKLMILQLMLQGAEEVKFSTVMAAGREGSQLLATKDKAALWAWVWVNGDKVQALMCGAKEVTAKSEQLCRELVGGLTLKPIPTTKK